MSFTEEDWDQESDYARYVLREPDAEDLRDKADQDRKRAKEYAEWKKQHNQRLHDGGS